ncbi:hypothetical protein WM04_09485 [Burkholderia ubonensis]|nr:hypothetical protein WM04_09485 [Burkholderia ubonensis]OJB15992.1 hypothetical protein BGV53_19285 [Burkholderia ubonensis]
MSAQVAALRSEAFGAGSAAISSAGNNCNIARATSTFDVVSHSSQPSGRRITTDRFSSPGLCIRDITGWVSALTVTMGITFIFDPSGFRSVRQMTTTHIGRQPVRPMRCQTFFPVL